MKGFDKQNIIWGTLLIILGIMLLVEIYYHISVWVWIIALFVSGLFAAVINWGGREKLANFITTYILWVIAGLIFFINVNLLKNEGIAVYVLWSIALPFVMGFFRNQEEWGLLIPAYVLVMVGAMVGLIGLGWLRNFTIPAFVMYVIALPFLAVFLWDRKNWWALIPSGVMGIIGTGFLLASPAVRLVLPLILIMIGGWILIRIFLRK